MTITGSDAEVGTIASVAFVSLWGVQIPIFSMLMAISMCVLVRLWVNRKGSGNSLSTKDNLIISSITTIISLGFVLEYHLSVFWACVVCAGISFSGEAVLINISQEVMAGLKIVVAAWFKKLMPGSSPKEEPETSKEPESVE